MLQVSDSMRSAGSPLTERFRTSLSKELNWTELFGTTDQFGVDIFDRIKFLSVFPFEYVENFLNWFVQLFWFFLVIHQKLGT